MAQLILSLLVVAASWMLAGGMLFFCVYSVLTKGLEPGELLQVLMMSCALAAVGLFLLPSGYYALVEMMGRPAPDSRRLIARLRPGLWIFALPVVILLGHWIAQRSELAWLFLPPLHLLAVGIPTAWIVYLGIHRLPLGSSRQMWGAFGSGLSIGPALIMILEVLAAVGLLIIAVVYLFTQPEMMERITELA